MFELYKLIYYYVCNLEINIQHDQYIKYNLKKSIIKIF